ncbi:hypothetical protein [Anaeromassilibacillus sp. An172]|uniref:hypothetical protein n=1 Tax=Anaeromassilibacillus sp. An172 TaxID=1965570 RepID=UPI0013A62036|nr:hypothetical protein [Anaeromassilibacillus sp. An172]
MAKQTTLDKILKVDSQITAQEKIIAEAKENLTKLKAEKKELSKKYKEEQNALILKILNDNGIETPERIKEILIKQGFKFKDDFKDLEKITGSSITDDLS